MLGGAGVVIRGGDFSVEETCVSGLGVNAHESGLVEVSQKRLGTRRIYRC